MGIFRQKAGLTARCDRAAKTLGLFEVHFDLRQKNVQKPAAHS